MYWTELWVAVLTAGLVYALWHQRRLARELRKRIGEHHHRMNMLGLSLGGKKDKRPFTPKPRARRVDTVFHDRDDQGREHWLCVNCGASVPQMGHTVKACEEYQAAVARADAEIAAEEALKAGHGVATGGLEPPEANGTPSVDKEKETEQLDWHPPKP